jgi:hypothetical protein
MQCTTKKINLEQNGVTLFNTSWARLPHIHVPSMIPTIEISHTIDVFKTIDLIKT